MVKLPLLCAIIICKCCSAVEFMSVRRVSVMRLKYRKLIARFKPLHQTARFVMYNSSVFFYRKLYKKRNYAQLFAEFGGRERGKRCFIIGNGPSLSACDLDKLKHEDCIGTNEIHRIFDRTEWRPRYYLVMDRYSKTTPEQIENIECETVFLGDYYARFNKVLRKDAVILHQHQGLNTNKYKVSADISKMIANSPTVSFGAMQIMAYLGYSEIYLLGFDHNYTYEFASDGSVIKTDKQDAHFFKDEIREDIIGNVRGMTRAYEAFRDYAEQNGITVKNATRGGRLEVFERIDLDDLIAQSR